MLLWASNVATNASKNCTVTSESAESVKPCFATVADTTTSNKAFGECCSLLLVVAVPNVLFSIAKRLSAVAPSSKQSKVPTFRQNGRCPNPSQGPLQAWSRSQALRQVGYSRVRYLASCTACSFRDRLKLTICGYFIRMIFLN